MASVTSATSPACRALHQQQRQPSYCYTNFTCFISTHTHIPCVDKTIHNWGVTRDCNGVNSMPCMHHRLHQQHSQHVYFYISDNTILPSVRPTSTPTCLLLRQLKQPAYCYINNNTNLPDATSPTSPTCQVQHQQQHQPA